MARAKASAVSRYCHSWGWVLGPVEGSWVGPPIPATGPVRAQNPVKVGAAPCCPRGVKARPQAAVCHGA